MGPGFKPGSPTDYGPDQAPLPASTLHGLALVLATGFAALADDNRALMVSAAGDSVDIAHAPVLSPAAITLECWVNLAGETFYRCPRGVRRTFIPGDGDGA